MGSLLEATLGHKARYLMLMWLVQTCGRATVWTHNDNQRTSSALRMDHFLAVEALHVGQA